MSTILGIDNSIGWAHWRLRGGWKNTLTTTAAFAGIIITIIIITVRANPRYTSSVLSGWRTALITIQSAILVLFASTRVATAIRSDITTRMLESHRLMPIAPATAISGYLWGPIVQPLALAVATFAIGMVVTIWANMSAAIWIGPNLILAAYAVFCWVMCAYGASVSKAGAGLVLIGLLMAATSRAFVLMVVPGSMLLASPLIGKSVFSATLSNTELSWPVTVSTLAQIYVGAVLYVGAARKYRNSEDTALAVVPALFLLAGWVIVSCVGTKYHEDFRPDIWRVETTSVPAMIICSLVAAMFLSAVGIANAARDRRWAPFSPLVAMLSAAIVSVFAIVMRNDGEHTPQYSMMITAAVLVAFMVGLCFLLRIIYRFTPRGWPIAFTWVLLTWILPYLADVGHWMLEQDSTDDMTLSWITGLSPGGALILTWGRSEADAMPGAIVQLLVAVLLACIFYLTRGKDRAIGAPA